MISAEVNVISTCKKGLKVTMDAGDLDAIREHQVKVVQQKVQLPGFRKGKAPLHMVKRNYAGTIEEYAIDEALQQAYQQAIIEKNITPYSEPVVKKLDFDDNKNLVVEYEIETTPEFELKKYKGIALEKTLYKIKDEDVEDTINHFRREKALVKAVDTAAKNGNFVTMDIQEVDENGVELVGKKYEGVRIKLGENQFDSDVEEQIVGMKSGEEKKVEKVVPEDHPNKEIAGKKENYLVKMARVEEEELPELNDEFAKEFSQGMETVDDLRRDVRKYLEEYWGQQAEQAFYNDMAHKLLQENEFDVPDAMVERYLDRIIEDARKKDKSINEASMRKNYRDQAVFNLKWYTLKDKIRDEEKVEVTDEDFEKHLADVEDEKMREFYRSNAQIKDRVMDDLSEKKVLEYLTEISKVEVHEKSIKEGKE